MKAVKNIFASLTFFALLTQFSVAADGWLTDINSGVAKAKAEKKSVLVEFTGSDWCPPCIMMHDKVFSKKEFTSKASEKFVLVKIDIPKKDKALYKKNSKVLGEYKVEGVPTVILLDYNGAEFSRFLASLYPSVDGFLSNLNQSLEKKEME